MTRFVYGRCFLRTCMSFYNHIMVPQKCQANTQPGNDQPGPEHTRHDTVIKWLYMFDMHKHTRITDVAFHIYCIYF